jgi:SAM-dependent methyltransferase
LIQTDDPATELAWTGERYIPFVKGNIELEHLHRYAFARDLASQKDILDIACGEGYGSYLLADTARSVIGVDLSGDVVLHARKKYAAPGLEFRQGDCTRIPLEDSSVDMVVSFETIEHHDQHEAMLSEIKRVLRPNGLLVISTPERGLLGKLSQRPNEFHVKELSLPEFTSLLAGYFRNCALFGQKVRHGSLLTPLPPAVGEKEFTFHAGSAEFIASHCADPEPLFLIALASESQLPLRGSSFFDGTDFLEQEMANHRLGNEALTREIARIKATISWRITKPLRFAWNTLRQLLGFGAPR